MWAAGLFQFPTFSPNLVTNTISRFMKVTCNEGHHHLTFHIFFAHESPYIYFHTPQGALGVFLKVAISTQGCTQGDRPIRSP